MKITVEFYRDYDNVQFQWGEHLGSREEVLEALEKIKERIKRDLEI